MTRRSDRVVTRRSDRVVKHHVLPCQLEQHRIIEELADGHVFTQTLSPPGLHHEFPGEVGGRLGLQGADHDAFIEWVTWDNLKSNGSQLTIYVTASVLQRR